jgi:hypothetical protein
MNSSSVEIVDHIATEDAHQWTVVPGMLRLIQSA